MKTSFLLLFFTVTSLWGQSVPDSAHFETLNATCRVWGFLKYFHPRIADGAIDWDQALLQVLKENPSQVETSVTALLDRAGPIPAAEGEMPQPVQTEYLNLDFQWMNELPLAPHTRLRLDSVRTGFRKRPNVYIGQNHVGSISFECDSLFYHLDHTTREIRLLALFRYWNIFHYFSPYRDITDVDWGQTLDDFIPVFWALESEEAYQFAMLRLAKRIDDSHAATTSPFLKAILRQPFFLPMLLPKYIDGETVVTQMVDGYDSVSPGDVIKSMDGIPMEDIRDQFRGLVSGSTWRGIERDINNYVSRGDSAASVHLVMENEEGEYEVDLPRTMSVDSLNAHYSDLYRVVWEKQRAFGLDLGYINIGVLLPGDVDVMFEELWNCDALIVDLRVYPRGAISTMIPWLFDRPVTAVKFLVPDSEYPGTFTWHQSPISPGNFSRTWDKPLAIIINEHTQSHGEFTAMILEQHPRAVKIGSHTVGADGNVADMRMPGQISTRYTGLGVFYPDGRETQRVGVLPDIVVRPTRQGIREGRDELLERAREVLSQRVINQMEPIATFFQNAPNPFHRKTAVTIALRQGARVELEVFDVLGREVDRVVNAFLTVGFHEFELMAEEWPSGVYFLRLKAGGKRVQVRKMICLN